VTPLLGQLVRYAAVGVASTAALYAAYLGLAHYGVGPKTAMTITYAAGVVQTFLLNRRWTFGQRGALAGPFAKYVTAYAIGYVANFALLAALVDAARLPHQLVQAFAIVAVAALVFLLQKLWVFRPARTPGGATSHRVEQTLRANPEVP